ncbi:MAG: cytochrome c oxidase subunit II [Vulcanimicrobiota bacterium]
MHIRRWKRAGLTGYIALLLLTLAGCGLQGPQSTLDPSGPVAQYQMNVFLVTFWVSVGIFLVVGSFMVFCLYKFRHTGEVKRGENLPDQGHGSAIVELGLILVSVGLVGIMVLPTLQGIFWVGTLPPQENPLVIKVTGLQWWWRFEYPEEGVVTGNELAIPAGRPVKFELHTADVIHSFWVPRLGGKMDLMPGQDNWLWLEADPDMKDAVPLPEDSPFQGSYFYGQCAEFCGESHAFMRFRVVVLDDTNFQKWVEHQKSDAVSPSTVAEDLGQQAFMKNQCASCHTIRGVKGAGGMVGPDLTHVGSRVSIAAGIMDNNVDNLIKWIHTPNYYKPGNIMYKTGYAPKEEGGMGVQLSDDDVVNLAKYLYSLK